MVLLNTRYRVEKAILTFMCESEQINFDARIRIRITIQLTNDHLISIEIRGEIYECYKK